MHSEENRMIRFTCAVLLTSLSLLGQSAATPAGHWEGTIDLRQKQVRVSVDLDRNAEGKWAGRVGFPDVGGGASALTSVIVKDATVSLQSMEALCGLDGTMSADGSTIKGEFLSAQLRSVPVPMQLKRTSAPPSAPAAGNSRIAAEAQGTWEGSFRILKTWEGGDPPEGTTIQLRIRLAGTESGATGGARGVFPNQNNELPVTAIVQSGDRLQFEIKAAGAVYKARLKGGELTGEWSQFNSDPVSLTLKRASR
jgi:hypothetical protein